MEQAELAIGRDQYQHMLAGFILDQHTLDHLIERHAATTGSAGTALAVRMPTTRVLHALPMQIGLHALGNGHDATPLHTSTVGAVVAAEQTATGVANGAG